MSTAPESLVTSDLSLVVVGKIVGVFGVKGWLKIHAFTAQHSAVFSYQPWYLRRQHEWVPTKLLSGQAQGKGLVAQLDGVQDRDQALAMVGLEIGVPRSELPPLDTGEYYWSDLMGLSVVTVSGQLLGRVDHLIETGANDVLIVKGDRERWLPWILETVIKSVDLQSQTILVDWDPEF